MYMLSFGASDIKHKQHTHTNMDMKDQMGPDTVIVGDFNIAFH